MLLETAGTAKSNNNHIISPFARKDVGLQEFSEEPSRSDTHSRIHPDAEISIDQEGKTKRARNGQSPNISVSSKRTNFKNGMKGFVWNEAKDNMLREGVRLHCGDDCPNWLKVAAYVNEQLGEELVNNKQCCDRWIYHADPKLTRMKNKDDEWTDEEVAKLYEIEALSASGKTRGSKHLINWKLAQEALGRKAVDCRHKWQSLQNSKLKKGPFEKEEDETIKRMVAEWGGKIGMWVAVGRALGRPARYCEARWTLTLCARGIKAPGDASGDDGLGSSPDFRWNEEKDRLLLEGVELYATEDSPNWILVAEHIIKHIDGGLVSNEQCRQRWKNHVNPKLSALKGKDDTWSEEEIVRLQICVEKNSKVSSTTGSSSENRAVVNWKAVQDDMGRKAVDCCNKFNCLRYHTLKKGPFDDKEDVVIKEMKKDWENLGRPGVWGAIGKVLGRPQHRCRGDQWRVMCLFASVSCLPLLLLTHLAARWLSFRKREEKERDAEDERAAIAKQQNDAASDTTSSSSQGQSQVAGLVAASGAKGKIQSPTGILNMANVSIESSLNTGSGGPMGADPSATSASLSSSSSSSSGVLSSLTVDGPSHAGMGSDGGSMMRNAPTSHSGQVMGTINGAPALPHHLLAHVGGISHAMYPPQVAAHSMMMMTGLGMGGSPRAHGTMSGSMPIGAVMAQSPMSMSAGGGEPFIAPPSPSLCPSPGAASASTTGARPSGATAPMQQPMAMSPPLPVAMQVFHSSSCASAPPPPVSMSVSVSSPSQHSTPTAVLDTPSSAPAPSVIAPMLLSMQDSTRSEVHEMMALYDGVEDGGTDGAQRQQLHSHQQYRQLQQKEQQQQLHHHRLSQQAQLMQYRASPLTGVFSSPAQLSSLVDASPDVNSEDEDPEATAEAEAQGQALGALARTTTSQQVLERQHQEQHMVSRLAMESVAVAAASASGRGQPSTAMGIMHRQHYLAQNQQYMYHMHQQHFQHQRPSYSIGMTAMSPHYAASVHHHHQVPMPVQSLVRQQLPTHVNESGVELGSSVGGSWKRTADAHSREQKWSESVGDDRGDQGDLPDDRDDTAKEQEWKRVKTAAPPDASILGAVPTSSQLRDPVPIAQTMPAVDQS